MSGNKWWFDKANKWWFDEAAASPPVIDLTWLPSSKPMTIIEAQEFIATKMESNISLNVFNVSLSVFDDDDN